MRKTVLDLGSTSDNKRYRQNMTEEQKEKLKEYNKRYRQNMTEEQKNKTITPLKQ